MASALAQESPHERLVRIISLAPPLYVPTNGSEEGIKRAEAVNAAIHELLLGEAVPEEAKVCYALQITDQRLRLGHDLSNSDLANAYRENVRKDREALTLYLAQLMERRK